MKKTVASLLLLLATAALALVTPATPAAAQSAPADAFLSGFQITGDYVVEVDGKEVPKAELYFSDRARSFLLRASALPSPVLISPAAGEVQSLDLMKVMIRPDGSADVLADAQLAPEGNFRMVDKSIVFRAAGKQVELKPRPWLLQAHQAEELLEHDPEYAMRARNYQPDAGVIADLKGRTGNLRVLTFFGSWCPHCRRHVPQLLKVTEALAGANWKFDFYGLPSPIGDEPEAKKYGINGVPTAIVFRDGKEIGRIPGALWTQPEAGLKSVLDGAK